MHARVSRRVSRQRYAHGAFCMQRQRAAGLAVDVTGGGEHVTQREKYLPSASRKWGMVFEWSGKRTSLLSDELDLSSGKKTVGEWDVALHGVEHSLRAY